MKKVSVIVPVYNVEQYLRQCLTSLVEQTLDEIEIIVVNDGTKDDSQSIIDEFAKNYPDKVLSLIKDNGGLADARNFGLPYASGEYIGFIDSDDYVERDMYKTMYQKAKAEDSDIVVCDLEYFFEDGSKDPFILKGLNLAFCADPNRAAFLSPMFAWNKIYRRMFFLEQKAAYPKGLWYEDIPVTTQLFAVATRICTVDKVMVHYRQRAHSIMQSAYNPKMHDIFIILSMMLKQQKEQNTYKIYRDEIEYLFIEHCLFYGAFRFLRSSGYKALMKEAFQLVDTNFPNWRKNRYLRKVEWKNMVFIMTLNRWTIPLYRLYLNR